MQLQSDSPPALRHATAVASADMQLLVSSPSLLSSQTMLPPVAVDAGDITSLPQVASATASQQEPRQSRTEPDLRMQLQSLSAPFWRHLTTEGAAEMQVFVNSPTCPSLQAIPAADTGAGSLVHTVLETALQHSPRQSRTLPDLRMQLQSLSEAVRRHVTTLGSAAMQVFVLSPTVLSLHDPVALSAATAVKLPDAGSFAHTDAATACQHSPRQSRTAPDARMQRQSPLVPVLRQDTTVASAWIHVLVFSPTVLSSQLPVVLDADAVDPGSFAHIDASMAPQHSPKQSRTPPDARTQRQSVVAPSFKQDTTDASAWMQVVVLSPTVLKSHGALAAGVVAWRGGATALAVRRRWSSSCDSRSSCRTSLTSASDAASFSSR